MKKIITLIFTSTLFLIAAAQVPGVTKLSSQSGAVTQSFISGAYAVPDASAILEGRSTAKGFLCPRMTTAQRNAIASPATGLLVYNTSTGAFNFYNGASWVVISAGTANNIYNNNGTVADLYRTVIYDPSTQKVTFGDSTGANFSFGTDGSGNATASAASVYNNFVHTQRTTILSTHNNSLSVDTADMLYQTSTLDSFLVDSQANLKMTAYPSSRDNSGVTTPANFLYSDAQGNVLSAPVGAIGLSLSGTNQIPYVDGSNSLTVGNNLIWDDVGKELYMGDSTAAGYFYTKQSLGITQIGDVSGGHILFSGTSMFLRVSDQFYITNYDGSQYYLFIDTGSRVVHIGDVNGLNNSTTIDIDDATGNVGFSSNHQVYSNHGIIPWGNAVSATDSIAVTGDTTTLVNGESNVVYAAGAITDVVVNLPSSPTDGDIVGVTFTQLVTTITWNEGTVVATPTSILSISNAAIRLKYFQARGVWNPW